MNIYEKHFKTTKQVENLKTTQKIKKAILFLNGLEKKTFEKKGENICNETN